MQVIMHEGSLRELLKYDIEFFLEVGMELSKSMGLHTIPQVIGYMVAHEDYYVELYKLYKK